MGLSVCPPSIWLSTNTASAMAKYVPMQFLRVRTRYHNERSQKASTHSNTPHGLCFKQVLQVTSKPRLNDPPGACSKGQVRFIRAHAGQQAHVACRLAPFKVGQPPLGPELLTLRPDQRIPVHQVRAHQECCACSDAHCDTGLVALLSTFSACAGKSAIPNSVIVPILAHAEVRCSVRCNPSECYL